MKVLKFGGTSVANAENIEKVLSIVTQSSQENRLVVVVSAFGGVTDILQKLGELANAKDEAYLQLYESLVERHIETAVNLGLSKGSLEEVERRLKELKKILQGIYLINEFSNKTKDKVLSFGELLSSYIISEALQQKVSDSLLKDSRELISTDAFYTQAQVNWEKTTENIEKYFSETTTQITLLPGFVACSHQKNP